MKSILFCAPFVLVLSIACLGQTGPRSVAVSSPDAVAEPLSVDEAVAADPQVTMVVGKVGRAETTTDPAPVNMSETTITFKPKDQWPKGLTKDAILARLDSGVATIPEIVASAYPGLDPRLVKAAGLSTLAHLQDLMRRGLAAQEERDGGEGYRRV